jgi:hypothetical protein
VSRKWYDGRCAECGESPKPAKGGLLRCACKGKFYEREAGIEGTAEETDFLKAHGFAFTGDIRGDKYYVGSFDRLIWFYSDGSWAANPRPKEDMTFEEYVRAASWEEIA